MKILIRLESIKSNLFYCTKMPHPARPRGARKTEQNIKAIGGKVPRVLDYSGYRKVLSFPPAYGFAITLPYQKSAPAPPRSAQNKTKCKVISSIMPRPAEDYVSILVA